MKTTDEIVDRLKAQLADPQPFDFRPDVLVASIPLARAVEVNPAAAARLTDEERAVWDENASLTEDAVRADAAEYLRFAFGKASDHRGLSAGRSVQKMGEYLWLLDLDVERYEATPFAQYGAPQLRVAAEILGVQWPTDDPGLSRMADGLHCRPDGCDDGCGL